MFRLLKVIPFILAFVLIGANLFWAPVCQGHMQMMSGNEAPMRCFYTGRTSIILALLIIVMGIEDVWHNKISSLTFIGMGIALFLLPDSSWGIGVCKKEGMACAETALWIKGTGLVAGLYGIVTLFNKGVVQVPS
jgi:hypothetical protein